MIIKCKKILTSCIGRINALYISQDSRYIVSASQDTSIKIFALETQQEMYQLKDFHTG